MSAACTAATFEGSGCRGTITDGQCSEQDDHHPTPGMLPYDGPGAGQADTGQTAEPSDAWVVGRFTDATAQHGDRTFEMWDDDVHRTSAAALHHHVMHVEDPDPWSWHIYALVRIAAPGSSGDTVQVPDVAAVLDRLNVAELAGDEEQEFNDGQRWMLQKIRRALLGTTREGKR